MKNFNGSQEKIKFFSFNLNQIWFCELIRSFERNPLNKISAKLIKFRNICLIIDFFKGISSSLLLIYFTIFLNEKDLIIVCFVDLFIVLFGLLKTLLISYKMSQIHIVMIFASFFVKFIILLFNFLSDFILSFIFSWKCEIFEFLILQIIFILLDIVPSFSAFFVLQNEIFLCQNEKKYLLKNVYFIF